VCEARCGVGSVAPCAHYKLDFAHACARYLSGFQRVFRVVNLSRHKIKTHFLRAQLLPVSVVVGLFFSGQAAVIAADWWLAEWARDKDDQRNLRWGALSFWSWFCAWVGLEGRRGLTVGARHGRPAQPRFVPT
jgi:hypothetical protein